MTYEVMCISRLKIIEAKDPIKKKWQKGQWRSGEESLMVHPLDSYVVPSLNMNISVLHRNLKILMKMSINSKITSFGQKSS